VKKQNETRVNLSGIVSFDEHTDSTTKAVTLVPKINEETQEYLTTSRPKLIEGSKPYKEIFERHAANGWPEPSIEKHQTFEITEVETISEVVPYFVSLGLDTTVAEKKAADIFQRGWAIAQQQEIYGFMDDAEQPEVEGAFSVALGAAQPGERKQKDPMAAAASSLKKAGFNITIDDLKALMATMAAAG